MKSVVMTAFAVAAMACPTIAIAQAGRPCTNIGETVTIGGRQYVCSKAMGQAKRPGGPDFDGRSRTPSQPVAIPQPRGISTQRLVFPGLSSNDYSRLQSSPRGRALIQEADRLRTQQATARRQVDSANRSGNAEQVRSAHQNLDRINRNLNGMQRRAQQVLVELR
jgi:hypothetical protein